MSGSENTESPSGLARKTFFRSVSWTDRSPRKPNLNPKSSRPQFNCKSRPLLPPLQPLSVTRRNVEEWPKAGSDDLGVWPNPPSTPGGRAGPAAPMEFESEKDKLAFFDKECSRICDHVYLGSDKVAKNREVLRKNGITHVLNTVGFVCPEYFKGDIAYKTLWLHDSPTEDITSILYDVFDYIEDVREQGGRVLVHCCQGVSRSTALVIAYLMWREGRSFDDAFRHVKAERGVANPNMGFACQLLQCQKRVHAVPASPNSVLRMYRMAPHSAYDSLHLVPKMITNPDVKWLDSRGAFIVHVPLGIYIWIGNDCNSVMANSARTAALQVVKYERAQGPVVTVQEGQEPAGFWAAFFCGETSREDAGRPAVVKHGDGNRKVDEYDLDFEIFKKALAGGVVPPFPLSRSGSRAETETCVPARENGWCRLRRKFTSGIMKKFLSSSELNCNNEAEQTNCSADSSSSLSTPCGSPDSFSCYPDSSPKFSSKSPSLSPSTSDYSSSFTFSPSSSNWSESANQSLQPSPSGLSISENEALPWKSELGPSEAVFSSGNHLKLANIISISPCIAERRGSNPPSLMLPSSARPPRVRRTLLRSCSFSLPDLDDEAVIEEDSDGDELMPDVICKPALYQWPSMEKVTRRHDANLETKSVYLLFAPSCKVLYMWLGHEALHDQKLVQAADGLNHDDHGRWEMIGSNCLKQMSLPVDATVQIVKQGEETDEFVDRLKQTSH